MLQRSRLLYACAAPHVHSYPHPFAPVPTLPPALPPPPSKPCIAHTALLITLPTFKMTPAIRNDRKRARTSSDKLDPQNSSDIDLARHEDCPTRHPQAERKRELERNRRNLVNIRFVELEKELIRSGPRAQDHPDRGSASSSDFVAKGKRIDKEAVLKEAAQRIASLRKEVQSQASRITSMTDEISHLRAEKLELRSDKSYLRSELENSRNETKRLRTDNIGLWQALRKQSVVKNYLASDQLAKIPVELFNRPKAQPSPSPATPSSSILPASQLVQRNSSSSPLPSASQPPSSFSPTTSVPVRPPGDPNAHNENHRSPLQADAILMHQTPEELSELFASYIPGVMTPPDRTALADLSALPDLSQSISLPVSHLQNPQLQLSHLVATAQPTGDQRKATTSGKSSHLLSTDNETGRDGDASRRDRPGDDAFSDIAYCV